MLFLFKNSELMVCCDVWLQKLLKSTRKGIFRFVNYGNEISDGFLFLISRVTLQLWAVLNLYHLHMPPSLSTFDAIKVTVFEHTTPESSRKHQALLFRITPLSALYQMLNCLLGANITFNLGRILDTPSVCEHTTSTEYHDGSVACGDRSAPI